MKTNCYVLRQSANNSLVNTYGKVNKNPFHFLFSRTLKDKNDNDNYDISQDHGYMDIPDIRIPECPPSPPWRPGHRIYSSTPCRKEPSHVNYPHSGYPAESQYMSGQRYPSFSPAGRDCDMYTITKDRIARPLGPNGLEAVIEFTKQVRVSTIENKNYPFCQIIVVIWVISKWSYKPGGLS